MKQTAAYRPPGASRPSLRTPFARTGDAPPVVQLPQRKRGKVLVVDDEPTLLRGLSRLLGARGYEVATAADGHDAVEMLASDDFDVVLSDIAMPGMDGLRLLRAARERDLDIPVILVTGAPAIETAVEALEYGAFQYLTKPIDAPQLELALERAVQMRRMARMRREAQIVAAHGEAVRRDLESSFARAMDTLWMAFQPIVAAGPPLAIFGYEALLRSREPTLPHPGAVLDAAEKLGRLDDLGRLIRSRAAAAVDGHAEAGVLFVNLHTRDLLDESLLAADSPLSLMADRVVLEITERAALDEVKDARSRVARLREMGFRIAVDDLGAGYAGLTSFALLEPEIVKLDMSLVRDVHKDPIKQKLIRSMTQLCHDMGMLVVGEGVETPEERDLLTDAGCDLLQGYLLGKPGPAFPPLLLPPGG